MTDNQQWLSRRYLAYRMFSSMWFVGAVWLYFYRLFITDQQVGILDAMALTIGLLAEVPSGALADKFGRDRMVRLGQVLIGAGMLIQVVGANFSAFIGGQAVMNVGMAFASGADDALFFERLNFERTSVQWRKLVTRGTQVGRAASLTAVVVGGLLHSVNPRLPWYLTAFAFFFAAAAVWPVKDIRPRKARKVFWAEVSDYVHDIKTGFGQVWAPRLRFYLPFIITVQGVFYATGWGLLRIVLLDRFHFNPLWGSVAIATCAFVTVLILGAMHRYAHRLSEKHMLTWIGLTTAAALLLAVPHIGIWGFAVVLTLYVGEYMILPLMSETLNSHAPEAQRA